jgi:hypothetical protein
MYYYFELVISSRKWPSGGKPHALHGLKTGELAENAMLRLVILPTRRCRVMGPVYEERLKTIKYQSGAGWGLKRC